MIDNYTAGVMAEFLEENWALFLSFAEQRSVTETEADEGLQALRDVQNS